GTSFESPTHVVNLEPSTIEANARFFPEREVPRKAITMGIATILSSRRIVLLASGEKKRDAIEEIRGGRISEDVPATALHRHPNVVVICDREASGDR
ncbi:MAG: 6-phosphogluconolactonase, partial [Thermoanaerobaculia bacterium]|nr:6-phosphogluconolactonase [Thermoanaerobaculia bacterium]